MGKPFPKEQDFGSLEQEEDHNFQGLPDSFDARTEWGNKIHPIRDQGHCGSCWALAATLAASDRFAIDGIADVVLSP